MNYSPDQIAPKASHHSFFLVLFTYFLLKLYLQCCVVSYIYMYVYIYTQIYSLTHDISEIGYFFIQKHDAFINTLRYQNLPFINRLHLLQI